MDGNKLNDEEALFLIKEILNNLTNDNLIDSNTSELEKIYSKPSGTINNFIFYDDISDPNQILNLLKKNTVIIL